MSVILFLFAAIPVLIVAFGLWAALAYNKLVALRNRSIGAWSDIDVQLKRRHDLVGNLVDAVESYSDYESETLQAVVEARQVATGAVAAGDAAAAGVAEAVLGRRLGSLMAVVEDYPDLKANQNYLDLQRQLGGLEDALQSARRYYNAVVRDFNTRIQSLPDVLIARAAGFSERSYFELDDPGEAAAPQVGRGGA
jgi:LemA protein